MHLTDMNNMDAPGHRPPLLNSVLQFGSSPPQSWLQSPPTQMPWGTSQPPLVRFTADSSSGANGTRFYSNGGSSIPSQTPPSYTHTISTFTQSQSFMPTTSFPSPTSSIFSSQQQPISPPSGGLKRKLEPADDAEMLCAVNKLHISEKKLISHHDGAHALNSIASTSNGILHVNNISEGQRIVLSEEVQQLTAAKSILPKPLLDRMSRPSMALVLWQPPNPRPMPTLEQVVSSDDEQEDNNAPRVDVDNNNSSTVDLNHLPSFGDLMVPAVAQQPTLPLDLQDQDVDMEAL